MPQWCTCPLLQFWGPCLGHPPVPGAVRVSRVLSPGHLYTVMLALKILPEGFVSGCRLTLSLRAEHTGCQTGKALERPSASDRQRCGEYIPPASSLLEWGNSMAFLYTIPQNSPVGISLNCPQQQLVIMLPSLSLLFSLHKRPMNLRDKVLRQGIQLYSKS